MGRPHNRSLNENPISQFGNAGNRSPARRVQLTMTEDDIERITALHFDGDPGVLAEIRRDPEAARVLDALDRVVEDLTRLRTHRH